MSVTIDSGTPGRPASAGQLSAAEDTRTTIAPSVVATVAGVAARRVPGVHALGGGGGNALGRVRAALPSGGDGPTDGVQVEVGEVQAAFDLGLVADYGVPLRPLAEDVRESVISEVEELTGFEVTEVNIAVVDVHLDQEDDS